MLFVLLFVFTQAVSTALVYPDLEAGNQGQVVAVAPQVPRGVVAVVPQVLRRLNPYQAGAGVVFVVSVTGDTFHEALHAVVQLCEWLFSPPTTTTTTTTTVGFTTTTTTTTTVPTEDAPPRQGVLQTTKFIGRELFKRGSCRLAVPAGQDAFELHGRNDDAWEWQPWTEQPAPPRRARTRRSAALQAMHDDAEAANTFPGSAVSDPEAPVTPRQAGNAANAEDKNSPEAKVRKVGGTPLRNESTTTARWTI